MFMNKKKTKIEEIRERFPNPTSGKCGAVGHILPDGSTLPSLLDDDYCVGGAYMMYHFPGHTVKIVSRFPNVNELAEGFLTLTSIGDVEAYDLAERITKANDAGKFEDAWGMVEEVLEMADELVEAKI